MQKTMMWNGVALVAVHDQELMPRLGPDDNPCERCYFSKSICRPNEPHMKKAEKIFGRDCRSAQCVYLTELPKTDAEWVEAKVADMRAGCDRERGERIDDDAIRAALLAAIARGRGE